MRTRPSPLLPLVLAAPLAVLVVAAPISAPAQRLQRPDLPFSYTSSKPAIISQQISIALQFERRALDLLATTEASPESAAKIRSLVFDSYVLVRFAHQGVGWIGGKSQFPNPLVEMEDDLIEKARGVIRECITALEEIRAGQSTDFGSAIGFLTKAITQLETLQAVMP